MPVDDMLSSRYLEGQGRNRNHIERFELVRDMRFNSRWIFTGYGPATIYYSYSYEYETTSTRTRFGRAEKEKRTKWPAPRTRTRTRTRMMYRSYYEYEYRYWKVRYILGLGQRRVTRTATIKSNDVAHPISRSLASADPHLCIYPVYQPQALRWVAEWLPIPADVALPIR